MIVPKTVTPCNETDLWKLYGMLQQQVLDAKVDSCIELILQLHKICTNILEKHPNDKLALDMEFSFIPSMIEELCDINMERMRYIFGDDMI